MNRNWELVFLYCIGEVNTPQLACLDHEDTEPITIVAIFKKFQIDITTRLFTLPQIGKAGVSRQQQTE